ncbi:hypothetical protein [Pseudomonas sp. FEN]|uniref:hypothetical protein n=1 Tax=Pseudomonas sp. FEN TaxID=2767468 RepID=UPI001CD77EA3|nr:hypothetical protein [Pseudomonas sp. FEN]
MRSAEGANDLVGLNRDTANANQKLDKPDQKAMQERIDLIQSTVQLATGIVSAVAKAKSDTANKLAKEAEESKGVMSDAQLATANATAKAAAADAASWNIGGDKRIMADIATGLLAAGLGGAGGGTALGIVANTTAADTYKKIGDYADQQLADATRSKDTSQQAVWAEGGSARILLHSLAGALQGLSSGTAANGALSAGASAAVMPTLDQVLKNNGIGPENRDALGTWIAAGVGAAMAGGNGSVAQASGALIAGNIDKYNRQAHPTEARLIEEEAPKLAAQLGITPAEAEKRMARAFAFYTDAQWKQTIGGADSQFDAKTLEHLGSALSPLAARYDSVAATLENGGKAYTPDETLSLIKNYNVAHSAEFKDYNVNIRYLGDSDRFNTANLVDYYKLNLDYSDSKHGATDPYLGGLVGGGLSAWSGVRSIASLGNELLSGHPLDAANSLLDPFVEPSSDMVTNWLTTKSGQDFVFGLQNNRYEKGLQTGKTTVDLATLLIPGPGEVAGVGKVTKVTELSNLAKLSDELVLAGRGVDDVKGAVDVIEVGASTKGSPGKLSGDYPSGTIAVSEHFVDDAGRGSSGLGGDGAAVADQASTAGQQVYGPYYEQAKQLHLQNPSFFPDPDAPGTAIVSGGDLQAARAEYQAAAQSGDLPKGHHIQGLSFGGENTVSNITFTGESTIRASKLDGLDLSFYSDLGYGKPNASILKIYQSSPDGVFQFGLNPSHTEATTFQNQVLLWQRQQGLR